MTELLTFGETALRLSPPRDGRLETADRLDVRAAGAASNVAIAASRLGTDATWTTRLADTPLGRRVVAELRGHGLRTDVRWSDAAESRQGLIFYESGNAPRDSVTIDDRRGTAIETVEPADLPMGQVQDAGAVFVSGETVALSDAVVETTRAAFRAAGGKTVLGLDYRPSMWSAEEARETLETVFPDVDVFVTNETQASTVLGKQGTTHEIAHTVASEWDFETVVVTKSDRGALVWHDATIHERDAVETETVDPTGGHAAFTGAFLAHRLDGGDVGSALARGVAAAALARTVPGPAPTIDPGAVDDVVADVDGGAPGGGDRAIR